MRKFRISDKEMCPCGSGILFKDCCKNKDVMSESQKMTKSMFEQQVINGQVLCDIRKSNQIMQYNQSQIANRMEHMHWLEEQKYLWG